MTIKEAENLKQFSTEGYIADSQQRISYLTVLLGNNGVDTQESERKKGIIANTTRKPGLVGEFFTNFGYSPATGLGQLVQLLDFKREVASEAGRRAGNLNFLEDKIARQGLDEVFELQNDIGKIIEEIGKEVFGEEKAGSEIRGLESIFFAHLDTDTYNSSQKIEGRKKDRDSQLNNLVGRIRDEYPLTSR